MVMVVVVSVGPIYLSPTFWAFHFAITCIHATRHNNVNCGLHSSPLSSSLYSKPRCTFPNLNFSSSKTNAYPANIVLYKHYTTMTESNLFLIAHNLCILEKSQDTETYPCRSRGARGSLGSPGAYGSPVSSRSMSFNHAPLG